MKLTCATGKRLYETLVLAEDALIESWSRNVYQAGAAPVAIYQCDDCGYFHFTSKGEMNEKLQEALESGEVEKRRRAFYWEEKLKRR